MHNTPHIPKINGKTVDGEAHLQPGVNPWIGVFVIKNNLFKEELKNWKSTVLQYKGSFDCRGEHINGCGSAKIIHIREGKQKDTYIINIEGTGEPELEKDLEKNIRFRYNTNLPID